MFTSHGLKQLIQPVTRPNKKGGTCIDWIVTNSLYVKKHGVTDDYVSDHLTIFCVRKKAREKYNYVYRIVRDLSNFDLQVYRNLLSQTDWTLLLSSDDVEYMWSELYKRMYDVLSIMCPYRRYKQREVVTPWLDATIYKAMRERDAFMSLFRRTGYSLYLEIAHQCRNRVNGLIYKAKSEYIKVQLNQNSRNPKKFWRVIKGLINKTTDSLLNARFVDPNTGVEIDRGMEANFLNGYFVNIVRNLNIPVNNASMLNVYNVDSTYDFDDNLPDLDEIVKLIREIDINKSSCVDKISSKFCKECMISVPHIIWHMMCKSLTTGIIPTDWTTGSINVIPKGGDLSDPGNWRPITQTSIFAKILEKIVHRRLLKYFLECNIISDYQFGFLPGRSTQLAIFELLKQIYSSFNNKKIFGSICLDVSKAFDCINHIKLFEKMISCGLSDKVLKWFKSYFTRRQLVKFNDQSSDILNVDTGIGQGTILGPLVFVFYINDVVTNISELRINMYADDCLIYTIGNSWETMFPKIQDGLNSFQNWCLANSLKLNVRKTKALILGSKLKTSLIDQNNNFVLSNEPVSFTKVYNYLGILLDSNMNLLSMLTRVKNIISNKIYGLAKIRDLITTQCALTIYKQTILPLFDYSGFVMISCNVSDRMDLQTLQNNALRICFNVRSYISATYACQVKFIKLGTKKAKAIVMFNVYFQR